VNIKDLDARFSDGADVTPEALLNAGLIDDTKWPVKVLGQGDTQKKLNVTAAACSSGARQKIESAGGSVTIK